MDSLDEFLLARIHEDEAAAKVASNPGWPWTYEGGWEVGDAYRAICEGSDAGKQVLPHIARWDPARVLAECETKRRIVELHRMWNSSTALKPAPDECYTCEQDEGWPCKTLRLLAVPYADHADYQPEWKP